MRRLFTEHEIGYAMSSEALRAERFAKRFAAKEATIKALNLSEVGLDWRQIEVMRARVREIALRLSHAGDYATAMVVALATEPDLKD